MLNEYYTLSNDVKIPKLGLGTWFIEDEKADEAVQSAIDLGYRHIDTAQAYENERGVGEGLRNSGVKRTELFVTTKLAAEIKSYDEAVSAIDKSLTVMKLDTIDLMLIHSPQPWQHFNGEDRFFEGNREAWRAMEDAYQQGKLKAIGVSNFQKADIDNLKDARVKPMVNQILAHISNTPDDLIAYSQQQNMLVEAYSPIGHGELLGQEDLVAMAKKYGVSVPQLCIRYTLQLGLLPLPKTGNPEHMKSNAEVNFEISAADMETLKQREPLQDYGEASKFPVYAKH